jgi:DNA primase
MLPPEFIDQVKQANNIVTVASKYLPVKQKGKGYWACCPFHHEKTPSFSINEQNQFYHCFGCGESGNVITLVMKLENTDFMGAIEILAKYANIKMPEITSSPEVIAQAKKRQRVLEILAETLNFYNSKHDEKSLNYLHGRGITDELIAKFNIGKSPDWDALVKHLRAKNITEPEMIDAGVVAKSERGKVYDAMAGRVTFAIFDLSNNCIGFTGRILPSDDNGEVAKYRNTAETIVFNKGKIVYGADVMKVYLRQNKPQELIVVEGNVDCISLVAAGFNCTIACMGTAMTDFHAKAIHRFANEVYLCLDGDGAGRKATLRSLDILAAEGLFVRVVNLPDDTDPDSFIRKEGKAAFKKLLENARPATDHKLDVLEKAYPLNDSIEKTKYLNSAIEILKGLSQIEREVYLPRVSLAAGVSPEAIKSSIAKTPKEPPKTTGLRPPQPPQAQSQQRAYNIVAVARFTNKPYAQDPLPFPFNSPDNPDKLISLDFVLTDEELEKNYHDSIQYLERQYLKERKQELLKLYESTGDAKHLAEMQEINKRIKIK